MSGNFLCADLAFDSGLPCLIGGIAGDQIQLSQGRAVPECFEIGADGMQHGVDLCASGNALLHLGDGFRLDVNAVDFRRGICALHQHRNNAAAGAQVADPVFFAVAGKFSQQDSIRAEAVQGTFADNKTVCNIFIGQI